MIVNSYRYDSFTGREYEPTPGLYYYRARWYDPKAGRFISEDPIGLSGGINLYSYVSNNPVNLTDPFGLNAGDIYVFYENNIIQDIIGAVTPGGSAGHIGIELSNGDILTSRPGSGVTIDKKSDIQSQEYKVLRPRDPLNTTALNDYANRVMGNAYDYGAIFGLGSSDKQTCAEVGAEASAAGGNPLGNFGPIITPNEIANSPILSPVGGTH